jgi:sarcosine oxidase gamma subunit
MARNKIKEFVIRACDVKEAAQVAVPLILTHGPTGGGHTSVLQQSPGQWLVTIYEPEDKPAAA